MTFFSCIPGMLAMRTQALRSLAEKQVPVVSALCFCVGFLIFAVVRSRVYSTLPDFAPAATGPVEYFLNLNLIQLLLFLLFIYIPALAVLGNAIAGDGLGLSVSAREYRSHATVLMPLWGALFLIDAPLQYFFPQFLVVGPFGISIAMLVLLLLIAVYTVWAIQKLSYLSLAQAVGVFALSWFTFPVYAVLMSFVAALPLLVLLLLAYLGFQWIRGHLAGRETERAFKKHFHALTANPQDADAHYQLGLIHLKKRNLAAAREYLHTAVRIRPEEPEYHYSLGQAFEQGGEWSDALAEYEETYRLDPEHGHGDIIREVGKGYLHAGSLEKAIEFLNAFLSRRNSDPEGRYWLAVALAESGDQEQSRVQLALVLEQARVNPRFFRKEHRQWIFRARTMLRSSRSPRQ
ncbi:MAG: tetratricopeptide repeat protein [Acidobacteria bacterium]|nr:tetratricopeptide repeat protein [Acidobacteriota bacterium]